MKKNNKKIASLVILALVATMAMLITSCNEFNNHSHAFTSEIATERYLAEKATCDESAFYYYSCACGEKSTETFEYGDPLGHNYSAKNTDEKYLEKEATCLDRGEYHYSCTACGEASSEIFKTPVSKEHADKRTYEYVQENETHHKKNTCCSCCGFVYSSELDRHVDDGEGHCCECGVKMDTDYNQEEETHKPTHNHVYNVYHSAPEYMKDEATCASKATYYFRCYMCEEHGEETFASGLLNPKNHEGEIVDGVCTACAKPVCGENEEGEYHYFVDCVCAVCGFECEHKIIDTKWNSLNEEDHSYEFVCHDCGFSLMYGQSAHNHVQDGYFSTSDYYHFACWMCEDCGERGADEEPHSYENGKCTICMAVCYHGNYVDGKCDACGKEKQEN